MQQEKKHTESAEVTTGVGKIRPAKIAHLIFIAGETAIMEVFELIKSKLKDDRNSCLTLIYFTSAYLTQPLFKAELDSLEKRFPSNLITHYLFCRNHNSPENFEMHQQILEIVINSNTCPTMQFLILGKEEMIGQVSDRLLFLGIKSNHIYSQIF